MPTVKAADNTELHFTSLGEGTPIVFLHGGLGWDSSYLIRSFAPMFEGEDFQLVFLDIRGNGRSKFDGELSFDLFVSDLRALCERLNERVVLFGHSYGGLIAQSFALQHPESLSRLILDSTFPAFDFLPEAMARIQAKASPEQMHTFGRVFSEVETEADFADATAELLPLYFHDVPDGWVAEFSDEVLPRVDAFRKGSALLGEFNTVEQLGYIDVPTWIAGGASDIYPLEQTSVRLNKLIPNSSLEIFELSGHFPFVEENEKYRNALMKFLGEVA
jgi:proline iminopeptidase